MGVDDEIEETENKLHNLKQQKCLNYEQEKLQRTKTYEEYLLKRIYFLRKLIKKQEIKMLMKVSIFTNKVQDFQKNN